MYFPLLSISKVWTDLPNFTSVLFYFTIGWKARKNNLSPHSSFTKPSENGPRLLAFPLLDKSSYKMQSSHIEADWVHNCLRSFRVFNDIFTNENDKNKLNYLQQWLRNRRYVVRLQMLNVFYNKISSTEWELRSISKGTGRRTSVILH